MIIAGVLGFVVDVAGALAKIAFVICLVGFIATLVLRGIKRGG